MSAKVTAEMRFGFKLSDFPDAVPPSPSTAEIPFAQVSPLLSLRNHEVTEPWRLQVHGSSSWGPARLRPAEGGEAPKVRPLGHPGLASGQRRGDDACDSLLFPRKPSREARSHSHSIFISPSVNISVTFTASSVLRVCTHRSIPAPPHQNQLLHRYIIHFHRWASCRF